MVLRVSMVGISSELWAKQFFACPLQISFEAQQYLQWKSMSGQLNISSKKKMTTVFWSVGGFTLFFAITILNLYIVPLHYPKLCSIYHRKPTILTFSLRLSVLPTVKVYQLLSFCLLSLLLQGPFVSCLTVWSGLGTLSTFSYFNPALLILLLLFCLLPLSLSFLR